MDIEKYTDPTKMEKHLNFKEKSHQFENFENNSIKNSNSDGNYTNYVEKIFIRSSRGRWVEKISKIFDKKRWLQSKEGEGGSHFEIRKVGGVW